MVVKIRGRNEEGAACFVELQCAVDGCDGQPSYAYRVTDTEKDLADMNELYVLCSKHTELTFILPPKIEEP